MDNIDIREYVKSIFINYLTTHKHRKTPERFAILDYIYSKEGHFDMDSLYNSMINVHFRVSKATVYNTIELLLDSGLVLKHQFGVNNSSQYEKAYGIQENHDHIICNHCGDIRESKTTILNPLQLKKIKKFTINYYSIYIYGICSKCSHAKKMQLKKINKNK